MACLTWCVLRGRMVDCKMMCVKRVVEFLVRVNLINVSSNFELNFRIR